MIPIRFHHHFIRAMAWTRTRCEVSFYHFTSFGKYEDNVFASTAMIVGSGAFDIDYFFFIEKYQDIIRKRPKNLCYYFVVFNSNRDYGGVMRSSLRC